ncbi:hypothetical protein AYO38_05735 [bacterium SCGC AG-212-C10]|nr:hypothetical protein AYO38_05735 [bacterium SCGC AG-212-C10]
MYLRIVRTTIAPGQSEAYWAWSRDILDLWDAHHIRRAGGPFVTTDAAGDEIAIWTTVHDTAEEMTTEFRSMYSTDRGKELIAQRPPLVKATAVSSYPTWDQRGDAAPPDTPVW